MWLFPRKAKVPKGLEAGPAVVGNVAAGPQIVRRVEITVEREVTSTTVRRRTAEAAEEQMSEGSEP